MTPDPELAQHLADARRRAEQRNCWETRKQLSEFHELAVLDLVRKAGWTCDHWGQGLLTGALRDALKRTNSPVRWAPDLLAVRGTDWCFIDAKCDIRQDTPNFTLEKSAYLSHFNWWVGNTAGSANFIYVWDDFRASHISDLSGLINDGTIFSGTFVGNGSGTSFFCIPKAATRPFEDVFGVLKAATA